MRSEQRDATRAHIVSAALLAMSEAGFEGVSTRAIAQRAKVSQGLLTYHFKTKDALWRAAADHVFAMANESLGAATRPDPTEDPGEYQRWQIRQLVFFSAAHPEFMRFMMDQGGNDEERKRWLTDTHVRPMYKQFAESMGGIARAEIPHLFYALAGASSLIFSVPDECKRVTGVDPRTRAAIQRHADFIARLIVPENSA